MTTAIVGFTGFVGSNLARSHDFDASFNSSNVADAYGSQFDLLVFAAAKAEKWRINQDPDADAKHISELEEHLRRIEARRVVLISTVDVYPNPVGVDEHSEIDASDLHPYGAHRLRLEQFVQHRFENSFVIRLPGLFGRGLKKNVIFDLLNDNNVDRIHSDGTFQFYHLSRLWADVERTMELGIPLLNITSAPLTAARVAEIVLDEQFVNHPEGAVPARYDIRSAYSSSWSGDSGYLYDLDTVEADLRSFVAQETSG